MFLFDIFLITICNFVFGMILFHLISWHQRRNAKFVYGEDGMGVGWAYDGGAKGVDGG